MRDLVGRGFVEIAITVPNICISNYVCMIIQVFCMHDYEYRYSHLYICMYKYVSICIWVYNGRFRMRDLVGRGNVEIVATTANKYISKCVCMIIYV